MLQFVFGKPLSGKTSYCMDKLSQLSLDNNEIIYIVPEQFTFETERLILKKLGDKASFNVNVLSFSRLYDEICRYTGGSAAKILNEYDKILFINKALDNVKTDLKLWGRYTDSISFSKSLLTSLDELKTNGVTSSDINLLIEDISEQSLKNKLIDLNLIYENYELLLGASYIDPADKLSVVYRKLENFPYFKNKTVIIDSFKGFTGQQYKIIDRILLGAKDVYISITNNPNMNKEFDLFSNIRTSIEKIKNIAKKHNVNIEKDIYLDNGYYNSLCLNNLEKLICGEKITESKDEINICCCESINDEADYCARTIRKLIRKTGLRYNDFAIIARDASMYSKSVLTACNKNDINCYFDDLYSLSCFPIYTFCQSALDSLSFSTENILKFHKTTLGTLTNDEISILENYCYLWNIDGELWLKDWDMEPKGFTTNKGLSDESKLELDNINLIKKRWILFL